MTRQAELNPLALAIPAPPVPTVGAWRRIYDGRRGPLIDLSQAVPGYPPHPRMLAWLGEAAGATGFAGYGPIEGEDELRGVYAAHQAELHGARIDAGHIHITAGCNQAFVTVVMALARAGESVALTVPFYFNHESALGMLGVRPVPIETTPESGFVPELDAIVKVLEAGAKVVSLVTPNNPTGAVYPPDLIANAFEACRKHGAWLVLDETYRDFLAPEASIPHSLFQRDDWAENLISLYSFSKSFCIPGHRMGAVTAGAPVIRALAGIVDNLQICPPRPPQGALAKAIPALRAWREENRAEIAHRAEAMAQSFDGLAGWHLASLGAYFAFVRHPVQGRSSVDVAEALARERGVLVIPGAFFGEGQEDYLRFAFANASVEGIGALRERLEGFGS
ncbi:MAG: aminotransferase [Methylobacterium mesophilicum]|nr:aminotransferase [Methylobacterium mesophilicum]